MTMKVEITIDRGDVTKAIQEWFKRQPEYQLVKSQRIIIGWSGGTAYLNPGGEIEEEETF